MTISVGEFFLSFFERLFGYLFVVHLFESDCAGYRADRKSE